MGAPLTASSQSAQSDRVAKGEASMKRLLCILLLALGFAGSASAQGLNGVVTSYVDLYAGPDPGYPTIAQLPAGTSVAIQGCTEGWGWCDVITMGMRGWVAGTFVQYTYQNQPVIVADYGPRIGIPIVAFSIGLYWGNYYRDRPFFRNRDYWYSRPYVPRPPPRPPGHGPGYRPPGPGYRPPSGHRPPSPPGHRPPPNQGNRPPPQGNRPPPSQGHRPPPQGNRPPPSQGNRPPPQGNRPPPSQGHRPPPQGNRPPSNNQGQRPQTRPAPRDQGNQGNH
jgi:uncharacterized protein YraI